MPTATHLIARVAHQRDAALDTRERLLATLTGVPGSVVLATCHRVESYEAAAEIPGPIAETRMLIDRAAVTHLFRVACGLDSAIAGEPQILRQIRAGYLSSGPGLDPLLRRLFERALHVGRDIRRTTALGQVTRSVGSLAVDEALRGLPDPAAATVLVVGAGEMGKLAVRALSRRVSRVIVANRDRARADVLAAANDAESLALDEIPRVLDMVDVVISAADTRGAVLTPGVLGRRAARRALVMIDIAVPRSVAEGARRLDGLVYRTVDDLIGGETKIPAEDVALAAERCAREADQFNQEWRERDASRAIRDVRAQAETIRRAKTLRAMRRLGHLGERDRRIVEALSVGLMNSLLHAPSVAMRRDPARGAVARELFGADGELS